MTYGINDIDHQYLVFRVKDKEYGINLLHIEELTQCLQVTAIPQADNYIRGIINLRGKIIPILDIKFKLESQEINLTSETVIIVLNFVLDEKTYKLGILVDEAIEVFNIPAAEVKDPPMFVSKKLLSTFLSGVYNQDSRTIFILDPSCLLTDEDREKIQRQEKSQNLKKGGLNVQAEYHQ